MNTAKIRRGLMKEEFNSKYQARMFAREMFKAIILISLGVIVGFIFGVVA